MTGLDEVKALHVLRHLQEGDVVWVTLEGDLADEEVAAVRAVLADVIEADVTLIVTKHGYVGDIKTVPLSEMVRIHGLLELAIDQQMEQRPYLTEA